MFPQVQGLRAELIKLVLPVPPSANAYLKTARNGRRYRTKEADEFDMIVRAKCNELGYDQITDKPIEFILDFYPQNRRRDLDNLQKVLYDSFEGVVYKNDRQIIRIVAQKHEPDKHNPRIEVSIFEYVD